MTSRWLDPQSVAEGPAMELPWWGWPCSVSLEMMGRSQVGGHGPGRCSSFAKLPFGPLTSAPRWKDGTVPRAGRGFNDARKGCAWTWSTPGPAYPWKTKRVAKALASALAIRAMWVLA